MKVTDIQGYKRLRETEVKSNYDINKEQYLLNK